MRTKVTDNLAVKKYTPDQFDRRVLYYHPKNGRVMMRVSPEEDIMEEDYKARDGFVEFAQEDVFFIPYNDAFSEREWIVLRTELMLSNDEELYEDAPN